MKPRILVVDDSPEVLGMMTELLRGAGYEPSQLPRSKTAGDSRVKQTKMSS